MNGAGVSGAVNGVRLGVHFEVSHDGLPDRKAVFHTETFTHAQHVNVFSSTLCHSERLDIYRYACTRLSGTAASWPGGSTLLCLFVP